MRKLLLCLCLAALAVPQFAAAQNTVPKAAEAIPDGEKDPSAIALENTILDAVTLMESGGYDEARAILDSLDHAGASDAAVQY